MRLLKQTVLIIIEFCLKLVAPLAATISMAAHGGFFYKVMQGFWSLPQAITEIVWWIKNIPQISVIVDDYNTLTAASFNQKYGAGAINYVMDYLNEGVTYLQEVINNLADEPVITVLAALVVFLIFYSAARLVRFLRQEGQGSVVTKFERRTGDKIFNHNAAEKNKY